MKTANTKGLRCNQSIELLESRIAPAAVFINSSTARCTDADGDSITVKFSKGILTQDNVDEVLIENGNGLERINPGSKPVSFSVSVAKGPSGDGLAAIGASSPSGPAQNILVSADGKTASFLDVDGDWVAVKFSRSVLTADNAKNVVVVTDRGLEKVDTSGLLPGVTYSVTTTKSVLGDGISGLAGVVAATAKPLYVASSLKSASYMDTDGDMVTVGFSRAVLGAAAARQVLDLGPGGLEQINLAAAGGSVFSVVTSKSLLGNGLSSVGATALSGPAQGILVSADGKTATFLDIDGDWVTVKFNRAVLTADNAKNVVVVTDRGLEKVDLSGLAPGTSYSVTTSKSVLGDGISGLAREVAAAAKPLYVSSSLKSAYYMDADGDMVAVAFSRAVLSATAARQVLDLGAAGLEQVNLGAAGGSVFSVATIKSLIGNGLSSVGAATPAGPAQGIEVSADGRTARFLDIDGDLVTVKFNRAVLTADNAKNVVVVTERGLERVDTSGLLPGVTYSVTTSKSVLGDGISGLAGEVAATEKPLFVSSSLKAGSYMDADGDLVTVSFSRAVLGAATARQVLDLGAGGLEKIDVSSVGGSDFSLSARKSLIGNGTFGFGKTSTTATTVFIDPGGRLARYIDPDGDLVTVTFSKAVITPENASRVLFSDENGLQGVNLNEATNAAGVSYTVATVRGRSANGQISIGASQGPVAPAGIPAAGAPAALMDSIFLNSTGTTASFVDVDGDWVSVALGRGLFTPENVESIVQRGAYGLTKLDLKTVMAGRSGVDVSVSVAKSIDGDAKLKVGFVDGSNTNFGHLKMASVDVGRILAGDGRWTGTVEASADRKLQYGFTYEDERLERDNPTGLRFGRLIYAPAAKSVSLGSINPGAMGLSGSDRLSEFFGDVPKFVSGDIIGSMLRLDGSVPSFVSGSIRGEAEHYSGSVYFRGRAPDAVEVRGDIVGGSGYNTGILQIGYGSSFYAEGEAPKAPARGDILVRGNIIGGTGPAAEMSGGIAAYFPQTAGLKSITVKGDIRGGTLDQEISPPEPGLPGQGPMFSGFIQGTRVGKILVEGDIVGGTNNTQFTAFGLRPGLFIGGKIRGLTYGTVGGIGCKFVESIHVAGEMRGTLGSKGTWVDATIVLNGERDGQDQEGFDYGSAPNAKKIEIAGGFTRSTIQLNSVDGVVDEIKIGGNFEASNIMNGINNGDDNAFGTDDDYLVPGRHENGTSRIGSVVVGGSMTGSENMLVDRFTIAAKQIGKVTVGGVALALTAGRDRIENGNLLIQEPDTLSLFAQ